MNRFQRSLGVLACILSTSYSVASELDRLGSNEAIVKRAKTMSTSGKIEIVQKRAVDRHLRFELGGSLGQVAGGNSYLSTTRVTGSLDFHINPRWSLGARYTAFGNRLTDEGDAQFRSARERQASGQFDSTVPEIDFPSSSWLITTSFYPMYGKLNLFNMSVVQFDVYALAGAGQINLRSGTTGTWSAGGGVGVWWNNWFSSRFEIRHQQYSDLVQTGRRDVGMLVGSFGIGILL